MASSGLEITLLLLAAVVVGVVAFRLLQLPPLLAYLAVGIVIGPHALGLVPDLEDTRYLAEFGVVFLMFSIGLEFSLARLRTMRKLVLGLGGAQVTLTVLLTMAAGWLVGSYFGVGLAGAFALGGALAMSSTAIVMKMLAERAQVDTEHGKRIVGVLLFQDLAVVPLLVIIPALGSEGSNLAWTLAVALVKAAALLTVLLVGGQRVMRWWFHTVAKRKSHELFTLNLLLVTLGLAWLTEEAGLSLALGAFVAGMLISETEFRHRVEEDIKPFRDVLLGLFFVTIGMLLNVRIVLDNFGWVMLALLGPVAFKFGLIVVLVRLFGATPGTAIRTGLALATAGEFGFVLLGQAGTHGLLSPLVLQVVLASMLLSMLSAPLLVQYSDRIAMRLASSEWLHKSLEIARIAQSSIAVEKHVVICGFGRSGQHLAKMLEQEGITYVALDLDPGPGPAGGGGRRLGRLRRRRATRDPRRGGRQPRLRRRHHVRRHAFRAEDPLSRARTEAGHPGHRSHAGRSRSRQADRRGRDRGRARGARGKPDARLARARAARHSAVARRQAGP